MTRRPHAFTIVELLVAMAVLALILVLFVQILQRTTESAQTAEKHMDIASQARVALDRLGVDLGGMLTGGYGTLILVKNIGGPFGGNASDALVFATLGRTQQRSGIAENDVRLGIRAYRVESFQDPSLGGHPAPMLAWGDGTITWKPPSAAVTQARSDVLGALSSALDDVGQPAVAAGNMLQFLPLAESIFRFEVCFLISDGSIVDIPPTSRTFSPLAASGSNVFPVALSAEDSADPSGLYVRALVVGIVGLDAAGRRLVGSDGDQLPQLADIFPNPAKGQTPLQVWELTSNPPLRASLGAFPAPVLRGIRTYQTYYYVN